MFANVVRKVFNYSFFDAQKRNGLKLPKRTGAWPVRIGVFLLQGFKAHAFGFGTLFA